MSVRWPKAASSLLVLLVLTGPAQAQETTQPPLADSPFNIDFVTGPVLGSGRIIGLGGAFTALAVGIDGAAWNPASYASRGLYEIDWFEWDLTFDFIPGTLRNTDFDNNGEAGFTYSDFAFATFGTAAQFGAVGLGGVLKIETYRIDTSETGGNPAELRLAVGHLGAGYGLMQGQLVVGLGARLVELNVTQGDSPDALVASGGAGPEIGALLRLASEQWRLGAAVRTPVVSDGAETRLAAGLTLPLSVTMPWELQVGFAYQLGLRPLNRVFVNPRQVEKDLRNRMLERRALRARTQVEQENSDARMRLSMGSEPPRLAHNVPISRMTPEAVLASQPQDPEFWRQERVLREQEEAELRRDIEEAALQRELQHKSLSRDYILLSAEAILMGPAENAVGMESFLSQVRQTSGESTSLGLRLGVEGEPIQSWLKLRAGSYLEPSRFADVGYRVHGTLSLDVRLFSWDLFGLLDEFTLRIGGFADVASRYLNLGLSGGLWH